MWHCAYIILRIVQYDATLACGVGEAGGLMRRHENGYQVAHSSAKVVEHLADRCRCHSLLCSGQRKKESLHSKKIFYIQ